MTFNLHDIWRVYNPNKKAVLKLKEVEETVKDRDSGK